MPASPVAGSQRPAAPPPLLRSVQKRGVGHIRGTRRADRGAGEPERGHHCPFRGYTSRSPRNATNGPAA